MNFLRMILIITLLGINHINPRSMGGSAQPIPQPAQPSIQPTPPQQLPIRRPSPQIIPQPRVQPPMQPKPAPIPTKKPSPMAQPQSPEKSYKDMVTYIKNARNVWDNSRSLLTTEFVNTIIQKSRSLKLNDLQQEALLQTARDLHAPFSGNKNKDIAILQSIDNQIAAAIKQK